MSTKEIISILRSNCSRLVQVVDNRQMDRIYEATEEAIQALHYKEEHDKNGKGIFYRSAGPGDGDGD